MSEKKIEKKQWVRLTRKCNNRCLFCLDKDAQNGAEVAIKNIFEVLKEGQQKGATRAVLSGGDPTLHTEFIDIITEAKRLGYRHIQCITNGRMFLYRNFLNAAIKAGLNEITFSFHGHNAELHDRLTCARGSFEQSLQGLRNALKSNKLIVSMDIVLNKMNVKCLRDIIDFFIKEGVSEFDLLQIIPFGRAWDNRDRLFYDISKAMPYLTKVFDLSLDPSLHLWTNRFPPEFLDRYEHLIQDPLKLSEEIYARREMFNNYVHNNHKMTCQNDRCRFCFLNIFCRDLEKLKTVRILEAKKMPACLRGSRDSRLDRFRLDLSDFDVMSFVDFFIKRRFFVKSAKCRFCRIKKDCQGWPVDHVHKNGFNDNVLR